MIIPHAGLQQTYSYRQGPKAPSLLENRRELPSYCCRKTTVGIEDQLLNFSVPELVLSQSTISTDPEVLSNRAGFNLCSSAGLAVGERSAVMGLTPCMLCEQVYCVLYILDYYLLHS